MNLKKIAIAPMIIIIQFYRYFISPLTPAACRYEPTCSAYFLEALKIHGLFKGTLLGIKRISSCHPWGGKGYDPVPPKKSANKSCCNPTDNS